MSGCTTCKWAKPDSWGATACTFPVPAWLLATVRGLEDSRGINRLGDRLLPNEFNTERGGYKSCPTWESSSTQPQGAKGSK